MMEGRCVTCGRGLVEEGCISLPCPECGAPLNRCKSCREKGASFECSECGLKGP